MKLNKKHEAYFAMVAADLGGFLQQAFNTVYPNKQYLGNWHIDAIVHCLEQCIKGEMPRLIVNLPPRHLKSFVATVVLPAFILAHDPSAKIICISYSDELAKTLARDFRRIVESEWYKKLFPNVIPSKSTENEFVTSEGGFRFATSINGTLTGRGGDFIIIDDPIKPEDTHSDTVRQSVNEWYKSTLLSRLDDKKRSVLILVMQRLHVNDLTGFLEGGGFHKLSLPAIATVEEKIPVGENLYHLRKEGSALHESREDLNTLEKIKDHVGPLIFSAQYQQCPETPEGSMFKREWIQVVNKPPNLVPGGRLIISFDTALSTSETADYTALSIIYSSRDGHFVLSADRGRWDYETLLFKARFQAKKYEDYDVTFIIENTGSGISLISSLKKAGYRCISATAKNDKVTRAAYILPYIHQHRLFIVDIEGKNSWVQPYINELVSFPQGRFDDQVDSLVHALYWAEPMVNPQGRFFSY
jgi:predicted phage terminase large subunit-like protein